MIHILYSCDAWHSRQSLVLLGGFTSRQTGIDALDAELRRAGRPPLSGDDVDLLNKIGQTQGYEGDGEFLFASVELDELFLFGWVEPDEPAATL